MELAQRRYGVRQAVDHGQGTALSHHGVDSIGHGLWRQRETLRGTKTGVPCCSPNWVWTWPSGVAGSGEPSGATRAQHCPSTVWSSSDSTSCVTTGDTLAGTKSASHRWSSSGTHADRTTTPDAANYCPDITWTDSPTCGAKSGDIVGTKTSGECCVVNSASVSWAASGQPTLDTKPAASSVCVGTTYTGSNNCGSLGTVAGTKAARHLWSSSGGHPNQTTRPVAANYCTDVIWTDTPTCATKSADIRGTKTSGDCCVVTSNTERWTAPGQACPDRQTRCVVGVCGHYLHWQQ